MDFIERWVGVSPDGGNGATEELLLMVAALAIVALVLALHHYLKNRFPGRFGLPGKRDREDHSAK
jgi:hypothetical protein